MNNMIRVRIGLFLLLLLSIFSLHAPVHAQDSAGVTIVPASIEESVNPGDVLVKTLTITNESDSDREYFIYKKDIQGVESGGVPIFAEEGAEKTGYEISEWIEIPIEPVRISAHSFIDLPVTVRVPDSATPGSHFGGVFVSVEPPKLRTIGAGVGYEVVSVFSIRINGNITDSARIRSFSTDKLIYSKKDVHFVARLENQGNILIRPRGPLSITSMFGTDPEGFTVNETLAGVFPGTMRDFEFHWESESIGFGRYEAILALAYDGDGGQKTIDATLVFWVFPAKIILTILGIFISVIVIGYILTKYYINQAIIRAAGSRRIPLQRYRKQVGISRFAFVAISLMAVLVLFLIVVLVAFV